MDNVYFAIFRIFWLQHMLEMHICSSQKMDRTYFRSNFEEFTGKKLINIELSIWILVQCHMSDSQCHTGATFFSSIAVSLEIEHPFSANSSNISSKKLLGHMNTLHWNIGLLDKTLLPFYQVICISVSFDFKKERSLDCATVFRTKLCYHFVVEGKCMIS